MKKKWMLTATFWLLLLAALAAGVLLYLKGTLPNFSNGLLPGRETCLYSEQQLGAMSAFSASYAKEVKANLLSWKQIDEASGSVTIELHTPDMKTLVKECVSSNINTDLSYEEMLQKIENEICQRLTAGNYTAVIRTFQMDTVLNDDVWEIKFTDEWHDAAEGGLISLLQDTAAGGITQ